MFYRSGGDFVLGMAFTGDYVRAGFCLFPVRTGKRSLRAFVWRILFTQYTRDDSRPLAPP